MELLPNGYPLHSKISWTTRPSMLLISISFEGTWEFDVIGGVIENLNNETVRWPCKRTHRSNRELVDLIRISSFNASNLY
ncbi:hypothetical protein Hdeb2414_s0009g00310031 [Helianthus debilis subsp. tardiflorus]